MERSFTAVLCLVMLLWCMNCSGIQKNPDDPEFYQLADLTKKPNELKQVFKSVESGTPVILKIDQGMEIPFRIDVDTPLVHLSQEQAIIRVIAARDFFIMFDKEGARISLDGQSWADTGNIAAMKSLLGFKRGILKIALASGKAGATLFVFTISTE